MIFAVWRSACLAGVAGTAQASSEDTHRGPRTIRGEFDATPNQDQTKDQRLQISPDRARRPRTLEPLWTAATRPSTTSSDETMLHGMQKVRGSNPLSSTDLSDLCSNLKWQAAASLAPSSRHRTVQGRPRPPRGPENRPTAEGSPAQHPGNLTRPAPDPAGAWRNGPQRHTSMPAQVAAIITALAEPNYAEPGIWRQSQPVGRPSVPSPNGHSVMPQRAGCASSSS